MKLLRLGLAVLAVAVLTGVAYVYQATETSGGKMAAAAEKFLAGLSDDQRAKATFEFNDKERVNYHFTPQQDKNKKATRLGLPLETMSKEQRTAALELLKAGTSETGYQSAITIMGLEAILRDLEKAGAMVRNPDWYFFTVFGKPSRTGKWGWRVEGHHLSLNFVVDKGTVVAATPCFFGANPATVKGGDKKGQRTIPESDDLAKDLFNALDDDQKKVALQKEHFREVEEAKPAPTVGEPKGVAAAAMTDQQRTILLKLLDHYAGRLPGDVGKAYLDEVNKTGLGKVYFAYSGGLEEGKPHTYRVQGPHFVIEFLNIQEDSAKNPANHIHSAWRSIKQDFGAGN
jgi:hypothetical protein